MRDFNMRDNNAGNIIINESPKLLIQYSNEELLLEEKHRKNLLNQERLGKFSDMKKFLFGMLIFFAVAAIWCFLKKDMLLGLISILLSIFIPGITLLYNDLPTEFEQRQLTYLDEISMILRERGVRNTTNS